MSSKPNGGLRDLITLAERVAATTDSHSVMTSALPHGTAYSALLFGILHSVIKASLNYYKIAEGLLTCLLEINEAILASIRDLRQHPNSGIVQGIAPLYCQIFLFLGEFMDSYVRKGTCRLLNSHNEDFASEFRNLIESVKSTAGSLSQQSNQLNGADEPARDTRRAHIRRSSDLLEEARLSQAGLEGDKRRNASQTKFTRQLIWDIQRQVDERKKMEAERGLLLANLLASLLLKLRCLDERVLETADPMDSAPEDGSLDIPSPRVTQGSRHKLTKVGLQSVSKDLQDFFGNDQQVLDLDPDVRLLADADTVFALAEWTKSVKSQVIAVACRLTPCHTSLISTCYVSLARQNKIPIISHFCSLPPRGEGATAGKGLVALAYSLARQLIELLPPVLDCDSTCDLSPDRFRKFDGTLASWKEVLSVIDTLLYFAPPVLFCVIDGLHLLEDSSTQSHITSLVHTLVTHTKRWVSATAKTPNMNPQKLLLKVIFTTAGPPRSLLSEMATDQLIYVNSLSVETWPREGGLSSDLDTTMLDS